MIKITDSTVFNTKAECIVNTINCVGLMGKGLALEFALRYPKLNEQYIEECHNNLIHTGRVYFYEIDGQKIINFPTKFHFKYPSQMEWVEEGLKYFTENYKHWGFNSVAFPLLGASNGGLNPEEVERVMIKYLSIIDIDVYICRSKLVEGKELEMVNSFKETPIDELKKYVRLTKKQITSLVNEQSKIVRFVDISKIKDIGAETYKSIFRLYYDGNIEFNKQLSLF